MAKDIFTPRGYFQVKGSSRQFDKAARPGHYRSQSPADAELSLQLEGAYKDELRGLDKLELDALESEILRAALGDRMAAEVLAEWLSLNLPKPLPLAFRAAAIVKAIKDSRHLPEERFRRLKAGEAIFWVEATDRRVWRDVAYLPLALQGEVMTSRVVPKNVPDSRALAPWQWAWDAYVFGYLIPAAARNAKELQQIKLIPALSLDSFIETAGPSNTPAEAFHNITRDLRLSPRDRALHIVFVEHGYRLKDVGVHGITRSTLMRQISRMRERAKIQGGFGYVFEEFEQLQGFSPLELPRAPGASRAWEHDRGGSVNLDTPKRPSGNPVHPALRRSELGRLSYELEETYRPGNPNHPHTCACGSAESLKDRMCLECRIAITETKGGKDVNATLIAKQNEVLEDVRDRLDNLLAGLEDTISVLVWKFPERESELRDKAAEIFEALRD